MTGSLLFRLTHGPGISDPLRRCAARRRWLILPGPLFRAGEEFPPASPEAKPLPRRETVCRKLQGWYSDEDVWPKDRSLKVFKQWFDVEHFELVEDVGRGPIENDEGPEKRHRFSTASPPRRTPTSKKPRG